jgi:hypothetical protein
MMQSMVDAVLAVHEARKRRVDFTTRKTFFGHYDVWTYIAEGPLDTNCPKCMELDAQDFMGAHLRQMFPDLVIMDEDTIYPNVHQTLWGKPTCKCVLRRASEPLDSLDLYDGDNLEPYKKAIQDDEA